MDVFDLLIMEDYLKHERRHYEERLFPEDVYGPAIDVDRITRETFVAAEARMMIFEIDRELEVINKMLYRLESEESA